MIVSRRPHAQDNMGGLFTRVNAPNTRSTFNPPDTNTVPFVFNRHLGYWCRKSRSSRPPPYPHGKAIQFFTWNLDFHAPYSSNRALTAINHLCTQCSRSAPAIINLQEVNISALHVVLSHSWVREYFQITDVEPVRGCSYFTVTLVSLALPVINVIRVPFRESRMNRDVLVVDIELEKHPRARAIAGHDVLRIANVHLESTVDGIRERPLQMQTVAWMLKQPHVMAGVVGGDVNALVREDQRLPQMNGLHDAFHRGNGYAPRFRNVEEEMGYTWGINGPPREPPTRRDKVLYTGGVSFSGGGIVGGKVVRRIGVRLKCEVGRRGYMSVSDHCGLLTYIVVGSHRRSW